MSIAIKNFEKAVELFRGYPDGLDCMKQIDESLVRKAEKALGLVFPPLYRFFLKEYGYCGFYGERFYGIALRSKISGGAFALSGSPDAIGVTLKNRESYCLPHNYIIVGDPGYGPYDAIDTSKPDENGECPVVMIQGVFEDPETGEKNQWHEGEQLAPDFGTYLYNQSKQALENAIENGEVEEV